jgi:hypothetical protein
VKLNAYMWQNIVSELPIISLVVPLVRILVVRSNRITNTPFKSDQAVTLTTTRPHRAVRIIGITSDCGLLRTLPERTWSLGQDFIGLQPNGNSFDIMAGLIQRKK